MMGLRNRRLLAILISAGCLTAGLGSGVAYAYFTSSGTGSGTASVGTLKDVTLVAAAGTVTSKLIPGSTGDVTLTVKNANAFPVTLTRVDPHGTPSSSACGTTGVTFAPQDSLNDTIAANGRGGLPGSDVFRPRADHGAEVEVHES
jgi:predicted ribosomally synthesized peptide with SipW-like signal peptide